jgi:hypothetical protein
MVPVHMMRWTLISGVMSSSVTYSLCPFVNGSAAERSTREQTGNASASLRVRRSA